MEEAAAVGYSLLWPGSGFLRGGGEQWQPWFTSFLNNILACRARALYLFQDGGLVASWVSELASIQNKAVRRTLGGFVIFESHDSNQSKFD